MAIIEMQRELHQTVGASILWLNVSPSFKRFDQLVLPQVARDAPIAYWEYIQEEDEASSIQSAVDLLHEYMRSIGHPVHLVGHGLSGVVALTYARQFPDQVRSLSLLAVAAQPGITWHSHYYVQRQLLPCSQVQLLAQIAHALFGRNLPHAPMTIVRMLAKDLAVSPSPHSLYKINVLPEGGVKMPLMVCSSQTDFVITPPLVKRWIDFFKPGDTFWSCPDGDHFFHHRQPVLVANQLLKFWQQVRSREVSHYRRLEDAETIAKVLSQHFN
jgi:pimeloyl-ACP methyl ester carboxylesterase